MKPTQASRLINALRVRTGRAPDASPALPVGLAGNLISHQATALLRGAARLRAPVFLGPRVKLRGKGGLHLARGVSVGAGCVLDGYALEGLSLGAGSRIGAHSVVTCTSHVSKMGVGFALGQRSGMGDFCHVGAAGGVRIGDDVIMGSYVSFHSQEHSYADASVPIRLQGTTEEGIVVEDGCWIGVKATLLDGTRIGAGSIVAAGAVVKGIFPPGSIIAGVPAKIVKMRAVDTTTPNG